MPTKKTAKKAAKIKKPAKVKKTKRMSKADLEYYKKLLLKLKQDMIHDIHNMSENPSNQQSDAGHVQHIADVATDMYDREFNLGLASNERELLFRIDEALKRIEDGTYGFCLATGKPISKARLKAIPYTEYCLEYQKQLEKRK